MPRDFQPGNPEIAARERNGEPLCEDLPGLRSRLPQARQPTRGLPALRSVVQGVRSGMRQSDLIHAQPCEPKIRP
jgi:hypothetical protein